MFNWFSPQAWQEQKARYAETSADDSNRWAAMQIRATTIGALLLLLTLATVAAMLTAWRGAGVVLVLALAFSGAGYIVGLLFSVPRAFTGAQGELTSDSGRDQQVRARMYSINTNLEQVSDWLTKIIVGVSLVEARQIAVL